MERDAHGHPASVPKRAGRYALTVGTASRVHAAAVNPAGMAAGAIQGLFVNAGSNVAFVGIGQASAVIPVPGTPQTVVPLPPMSSQVLTIPDGAVISGIASATGNTLYVCIGAGF